MASGIWSRAAGESALLPAPSAVDVRVMVRVTRTENLRGLQQYAGIHEGPVVLVWPVASSTTLNPISTLRAPSYMLPLNRHHRAADALVVVVEVVGLFFSRAGSRDCREWGRGQPRSARRYHLRGCFLAVRPIGRGGIR